MIQALDETFCADGRPVSAYCPPLPRLTERSRSQQPEHRLFMKKMLWIACKDSPRRDLPCDLAEFTLGGLEQGSLLAMNRSADGGG